MLAEETDTDGCAPGRSGRKLKGAVMTDKSGLGAWTHPGVWIGVSTASIVAPRLFADLARVCRTWMISVLRTFECDG